MATPPNWYEVGRDEMFEYLVEETGLTLKQVKSVYVELTHIGLIDYDTEKDVIWEQFCDYD